MIKVHVITPWVLEMRILREVIWCCSVPFMAISVAPKLRRLWYPEANS